MPSAYIKRILNSSVYDLVIETPIEPMQGLSQKYGCDILVKREDLQGVFSFKIRGAYNKMLLLTDEERQRGVITASAGNHAQGVATAAKKMGIKATIVMPITTPAIKINSVKSRGGDMVDIVLHGDCFDAANQHALQLKEERNLVFVHPYDDPDVIAGQGTIAMEIIRQLPQGLDAVFVPVGGGGLLAGIAVFLKWVRPEIKIIAVEPEDAACLYAAHQAKSRVKLPKVGIFADGVAVAQIGKETYRLIQQYVDDYILVSTDEICSAIRNIFEDTRSIAEPAGASALAGLKKYIVKHQLQNKRLLFIESGANINFSRLRYVSQRADIGDQNEVLFAAKIPECPGSLVKFCEAIGSNSITQFNYRYNDSADARIFVGLQMDSSANRHAIFERLAALNIDTQDFTNNELAKEHITHMIGGHPKENQDERLFCFEFPERSGALLEFLQKLNPSWNISLFQYRNEGNSYGRVFIGFQIPSTCSETEVVESLKQLPFSYTEETQNPAYQLFLK